MVKGKVKEFVDGVDTSVVQPGKAEKPLNANDVYAEGRSVGTQEGLIYAIQVLQHYLNEHQKKLKDDIGETANVEPVQSSAPKKKARVLHDWRVYDRCGVENEVHRNKKLFICSSCGGASQ